jgi:hypothetical protein
VGAPQSFVALWLASRPWRWKLQLRTMCRRARCVMDTHPDVCSALMIMAIERQSVGAARSAWTSFQCLSNVKRIPQWLLEQFVTVLTSMQDPALLSAVVAVAVPMIPEPFWAACARTAIQVRDVEALQVLLRQGHVRVTEELWLLAVRKQCRNGGYTMNCRCPRLVYLLVQYGVHKSLRHVLSDLLHWAAAVGDLCLMHNLMQYDVSAMDMMGPLINAVRKGRLAMVQVLVQEYAVAVDNGTPLFHCMKRSRARVFEWLWSHLHGRSVALPASVLKSLAGAVIKADLDTCLACMMRTGHVVSSRGLFRSAVRCGAGLPMFRLLLAGSSWLLDFPRDVVWTLHHATDRPFAVRLVHLISQIKPGTVRLPLPYKRGARGLFQVFTDERVVQDYLPLFLPAAPAHHLPACTGVWVHLMAHVLARQNDSTSIVEVLCRDMPVELRACRDARRAFTLFMRRAMKTGHAHKFALPPVTLMHLAECMGAQDALTAPPSVLPIGTTLLSPPFVLLQKQDSALYGRDKLEVRVAWGRFFQSPALTSSVGCPVTFAAAALARAPVSVVQDLCSVCRTVMAPGTMGCVWLALCACLTLSWSVAYAAGRGLGVAVVRRLMTGLASQSPVVHSRVLMRVLDLLACLEAGAQRPPMDVSPPLWFHWEDEFNVDEMCRDVDDLFHNLIVLVAGVSDEPSPGMWFLVNHVPEMAAEVFDEDDNEDDDATTVPFVGAGAANDADAGDDDDDAGDDDASSDNFYYEEDNGDSLDDSGSVLVTDDTAGLEIQSW